MEKTKNPIQEQFDFTQKELIKGSQLDRFRDLETSQNIMDFARDELKMIYGLYVLNFAHELALRIVGNINIQTSLDPEDTITQFKDQIISRWNDEDILLTYKILRETQQELLAMHVDQLN